MACEVDDEITRCLVDLHDGAAAAVLHIPSRVVGVAKAPVVAPCDDRIADLERLAAEVDRRSAERARRDETRARPLGQVLPHGVAGGDHRVAHARLPVGEPVVDQPVVQLVGRGRARDAPGRVPAGERLGDATLPVLDVGQLVDAVALTVVRDEGHHRALGGEAR